MCIHESLIMDAFYHRSGFSPEAPDGAKGE